MRSRYSDQRRSRATPGRAPCRKRVRHTLPSKSGPDSRRQTGSSDRPMSKRPGLSDKPMHSRTAIFPYEQTHAQSRHSADFSHVPASLITEQAVDTVAFPNRLQAIMRTILTTIDLAHIVGKLIQDLYLPEYTYTLSPLSRRGHVVRYRNCMEPQADAWLHGDISQEPCVRLRK